ncbi:MAG TPA: methyltransferase domain-containing protein [Stackebrandtia sp.]|jgi:protein-L-isoaspartate O-methyltransferase|uniref:methyltransferase domain-containing protein n=1 Tax=Stackebrandtia sp. TaxID=2023065 RepID=UPI002D3EFC40|nr:methyltransferase domain-containing protein [Stackebrandtia sp.]HZE40525.1 methyltransferase domain-containing protein [Stackebrandtia sp.]
MTGGDWRPHAARLAEKMRRQGLDDPAWVEAFATVPRHVFVGGDSIDDDGQPVDTAGWDRRQLLRQSYADRVIVTRFREVDGVRVATSSVSQPAIVAIMLRLLDVADGCRVLEIGTGPGYNAALLCARLGDADVTTMDLQADVAADARKTLERLGFRPHIAVGDGALGCPARAPFDRVIATCGLDAVPPSWLDQLAPGAKVLAPMNFGGALATLERVGADTLVGGFAAERGYFMELRHDAGVRHTPRVNPLGDMPADLQLWTELCRASATPVAGDWHAHGEPGRDRFGYTVTRTRQWVWLDSPDSGVRWELQSQ